MSGVKQEPDIDGLVQDSSIFIANTLRLLQSCTKPSIYSTNSHISTLPVQQYLT